MELFRKSALNRLSSLEQLDKMTVITPPMTWLLVLGGFIITVSTLVFCIFGKVPVSVQACGIIVPSGSTDDRKAVLYVPDSCENRIQTGMKAVIYPVETGSQKNRHINVDITDVSSYEPEYDELLKSIRREQSAELAVLEGAYAPIVCSFRTDNSAENSFISANLIANEAIDDENIQFTANIILYRCSPLEMLVQGKKHDNL